MLVAALLLQMASVAPPDLVAVGTVVARTQERSVAILCSGGRTRVVSVGETAFGGRLLAVTGESVTLGFGEQRIELRVASAPPAPPRVAPQAVPQVETRPAGPSEDPTTPHRAMERREVERRLGAEIPRILAETAIQPVLQDGRVAGVMLTRVPEGSLLVDAGLRAGDVLTRINDVEIDGMATLIGLWPRLQGATEIRAVVLREGRPVTLGVTLR